MKYADGPTTDVEVVVDAPPATVWSLVADIRTPLRFSQELQDVRWLDDDRFVGRNYHPAMGEWETTCTVVAREVDRAFAWVVGDPADPSAQWGFTLEPDSAGTRLRQWMRIGPARSGLNFAIDARPDKEERIIARRLEEHRANMVLTIEGIKAIAEGSQPSTGWTRSPAQADRTPQTLAGPASPTTEPAPG